MKLFRFSGLFLLSIIIFLSLHPFCLKQSVYSWIFESVYKNEKTRIDIYDSNALGVSILEGAENAEITYPEDCQRSDGSCVSLSLPITKDWENYNISYKLQGNGKSQIRLRSKNEWRDARQFPILVDYKELYINNQPQNIPENSLWFNKFYETPDYDYADGDTFTISFKARRHHFKLSDFYLLISSYSGWKISSYKSLIGVIIIILISLGFAYSKKYRYLYCFWILTFLILPFLYISKEKISDQENRTLAKFPTLYSDGKINERFGVDFNNWFSDRFGGRKLFIDSRFSILYLMNNKMANEKAFLADDGWVFPTKGIKKIASSDEQYEQNIKVATWMKKIADTLKEKNIQFYLVMEPSRSLLYKKYWDKYYPYIPYIDYINGLKREFKDYPNIKLIDLKDIFEKNKDQVILYEKNDPHMTLPAVNLMMEAIASELGKDIYQKYSESISYKNSECKLFSFLHVYDDFLGISSTVESNTCRQIIIPNSKMNIIEKEIGFQEGVVSEPFSDRDLYILFPCYEEFIFPVLGEFFAHTISVNYNAFEEHDEEKLRNKALSKLKSVKSETIVLIFLSYPTEYNVSRSTEYLEAF